MNMLRILLTFSAFLFLSMQSVRADVYKLVSSVSDLQPGDDIIIAYVAGEDGVSKAMGPLSASEKYRIGADITVADDKITSPGPDVLIITLLESGDEDLPWILKAGDSYLYVPQIKNELLTTTVAPTARDHLGYYVKIEFTDGFPHILCEHISPTNSEMWIQYNDADSDGRFSYYWSTQHQISIFKLYDGGGENPDPDPDPDPAEPQDPGLEFTSDAVSYVIGGGEQFVAPTLINPHNVSVTYASSNPDVARVVTNNGSVTIEAPGVATITATSVATDQYLSGMAMYTITVTEASEPPAPPSDNEASFLFSEMSFENGETITGCEADGVTITLSKGDGSTAPAYYNSGSALRLYAKNTMMFSVSGGYYISEICLNTNGALLEGYSVTSNGTSAGTMSESADKKSYTWSGGSGHDSAIQLTQGGTTGHTQIKSVTVKYLKADDADVCNPVVTMVNDGDIFKVEMNCATEGAHIYYTTDGSAPTESSTLYQTPVTVTSETTFKAIASKDGKTSGITVFKATPTPVYSSFQPLYSLDPAPGESVSVIVKADMKVIYHLGNDLYAKTADSYMLLYNKNGFGGAQYQNGDYFTRAEGAYALFNGQPEIQDAVISQTVAGAAVDPEIVDGVGALTVSMINHYVKVNGVNISGINGKEASVKDNEGATILLYNKFLDAAAVTEGEFNITGFIGRYNTALQLIPVTLELMSPPALTPRVTIGDAVAPTSAPIELLEGDIAVITFTLEDDIEVWYRITPADGSDASSDGDGFSKYVNPVAISSACVFEYYTINHGVKSQTAMITFTSSGNSSIMSIEQADDTATEYFDLMGRRVSAPSRGVYIRRAPAGIQKVAIK